MSPSPKEIVNRSTGERIVFLRTAQETEGALLEMDDFWARDDHQTPEHIHPAMEERWEVIAGKVRLAIDGITQTAGPDASEADLLTALMREFSREIAAGPPR